MKMKELESLSGVGREAIRFYIREGLLPEPERPKKNVARYNERHLIRIKAIKRLQEERYLPLAVIKALLNVDDDDRQIDPQAFPHLDVLLHANLDSGSPTRVSVEQLKDATGIEDWQLEDMDRVGMISLQCDTEGALYLDARDAAIARCSRELHNLGFTKEAGFDYDGSRLYVEFIEWLTKEEVKRFYSRMGNKLSTNEAAQIGARAIGLSNDLIAHMRTRAILKELDALNASSQRPPPEKKGPGKN